MGLNIGPAIDNYSWILFTPLHCAKRRHTATRTVDKHAATRELVFKTAYINGPNPESVSSTPPFHNLCKNPCAMRSSFFSVF